MKNEFLIAITQVSAERHLPKEVVLEAIEQALVSAYKRNFGAAQNIDVKIDPSTGKARVFAEKEVVEELRDERTQISLQEARRIDPAAAVGGAVKIELTPRNFGRIAAQTAKQVILQRIREAERETMYADWSDRKDEDILGTVRNVDAAGNVILSLGRAEAIMPRSEQIPTEHYGGGQRLRAYIYEVEKTSRGPRIKVSRTHHKLLRRLLEKEVPEIFNGVVEIKAIAREPGSRSKVAVAANQPGVDPVGSCVGMRGVRIQNIVNELNGEKIDVVSWSPDEPNFIANALSPAKVEHVWLDRETKTATVVVPDNQLSLAIGKEGQNARLAAKLTNWRIDIKNLTESAAEIERRTQEAAEAAALAEELAAKREAAAALLAEAERALAEEETPKEAVAEEAPTAQVEAEALPQAAEAAPAVEVPVAAEPVAAPAAEVPVAAEPVAAPAETVPEGTLAQLSVVEEAASTEPAPAAAEAEVAVPVAEAAVWVPGEEELEEDEEPGEEGALSKKKGKKKARPTELVYDEEAGRVVRRVKRKPSRARGWEEEVEW